jgi:cobyrinic acid a,c-diamide synthase
VPFSPLNDTELPKNLSGLYIGGGYPEEYAKVLEANKTMRTSIKNAILNKHLPVYAECGGYMYLTKSIENLDNEKYDMVGVIDATSHMTKKLQFFGYFNVEFTKNTAFAKENFTTKAHEFHYSTIDYKTLPSHIAKVEKKYKSKNTASHLCGININNTYAAYQHIHLWSNIEIAKTFINSCLSYYKLNKV